MQNLFETPIYLIGGILLKLEQLNIGGSHKSRAARWMIARALKQGLEHGSIILEKTGGNLGIGLAIEAAKHGLEVELAVGMNFSARKKELLKRYGASLIGYEMMRDGALPREVIAYHLENQEKMGKRYIFLDQFSNLANLDAHLMETGPEIVRYIERQNLGKSKIFLVGGVGSGASICGVGTAMKKSFPHVEVIAVQPEGCDVVNDTFVEHELQGIAVGVKPKILREEIIDQWVSCSETDAFSAREWLLNEHGIFAGPSTGGNIHVAKCIEKEHPDSAIVTFAYDSGESYE